MAKRSAERFGVLEGGIPYIDSVARVAPAWANAGILLLWFGAAALSAVVLIGFFAPTRLVLTYREPAPRSSYQAPSPEHKSRLLPEPDPKEAVLAEAIRNFLEGNSRDALEVLDRYDREYANGKASARAVILRVELLRSKRLHRRASALARQFIARHPEGPCTDALKELISEPKAL